MVGKVEDEGVVDVYPFLCFQQIVVVVSGESFCEDWLDCRGVVASAEEPGIEV